MLNQIINLYLQEAKLWGVKITDNNLVLLKNYFGSFDGDLKKLTRNDFIKFYENNVMRISYSSFSNMKMVILDFVVWCVEHEFMTDAQCNVFKDIMFDEIKTDDSFEDYYYESYDELWHSLGYSDIFDGSCECAKVAILLCWFGIKSSKLVDILKTDIDKEAMTVKNPENGKLIKLPEDAFKVVVDYAEAKTTVLARGLTRTLTRPYMYSDYLFRTHINAKMKPTNLYVMLNNINKKADECNIEKRFQLNKIYISGVFSRIFEWENENGSITKDNYYEVINEFITEKTRSNRWKRWQEYLKYKEYITQE